MSASCLSPAGSPVDCGCVGAVSLERVRYFPRQLITSGDLTQEQDYFRSKSRRHNRMLHGFGIVCGCDVVSVNPAQDWSVVVQPGYVLTPQGDEVVIDQQVTVDLRTRDLDGNAASSCADPLDPWCGGVRIESTPATVYIAVAYHECDARPVRIHSTGCGCDDGACEYSRTRDGYVISVLDQATYDQIADGGKRPQSIGTQQCPRGCPPCPNDNWIVLARVSAAKTIADGQIDRSVRHFVPSAMGTWFTCATGLMKITGFSVLDMFGNAAATAIRRTIGLPADAPEALDITSIWLGGDRISARRIALDITFDHIVRQESVVDGDSLKVVLQGVPQPQVVPGEMEWMSETSLRWTSSDRLKPPGELIVTLAASIVGSGGEKLDGEPVRLPSGDGIAGGDFVTKLLMRG